jgi:branched-chain amino acid transport system substrate-binding protein
MRRVFLALAAAVSLVSAGACSGGSGGGGPASVAEPDRTVTIGVLAPLEGGLTEFGRGIRNSVELAVREANAAKAVPGWTITVKAVDDSSDPATGTAGAATLAADTSVVAVVGPYNSGVATAVLPTLQAAGMALVSPSNTLTSLSLGDNAAAPKRPFANYFRMVGNDAKQGEFLAEQALKLGLKTAAVVSETKAVSKGLADAFVVAFKAKGGVVTVQQTVPDGTTDFAGFVATASAMRPEFIFFGGEYPVAAALRKAASAANVKVPVLGGDGIKDDAFIAKAGADAAGTLASSVGAPIERLAGAGGFVAAYSAAGFAEGPSGYGVYAYDATKAVIGTLKAALASAGTPADARSAVIAALGTTSFDGSSGPVAFDAFGDPRTPTFTLYKVVGTAWVAQG